MIVVDASAVLEMLLRTGIGEAVSHRLLADGESLHAPHLLDIEVAQVVRRYAQRGAFPSERARDALADFSALAVQRYPHDVLLPRVWDLRHNLSAYDAVYVALAETLDAPLLTGDRRIAAAPGHAARIELIAPQ